MKFKLLFTLLGALLIDTMNAQSVFQISYIGAHLNMGYSVQSDNTGFIIAGTTSSSGQGGKDVLLMKTDLNGVVIWSKTIGGKGDEIARTIKKTSDGGYVIVGSTSSYVYAASDSSNCYIIKTDYSGNILWTRSIGSYNKEVANDVIETYNHKYAVVGYTKSIGPGNEDIYFMELDSAGTLQWAYGMGSTASDFGNSVLQTSTHDFIIVGSTTGFGTGGQTPYLITTSEQGVIQSPSYTFNFNTSVSTKKRYFTKIINGYFNDYVITGSDGLGSAGDAQHIILDIGQNITINWMNKYYLNSGEGVSTSIEKTNTGGFILGGTMGIDHPALIKTDAIGQLLGTKIFPTIGSSYYGKGLDVKANVDGGFTLVGYRYNSSDTAVYLIKTDSSLSSGCDEVNAPIGSASNMSPTYSLQTTTSGTGSNYIAIDSGIVATATPFMNTICSTAEIKNITTQEQVSIYPNPSTGIYTIQTTAFDNASVEIYNLIGQKVFTDKLQNNATQLNLSSLANGMYQLRLIKNNAAVYQTKISKVD